MSGAEPLIDSQRAVATLRESEEPDRAVAEAGVDAIITIDSNNSILIVNPACHSCLLAVRLSSNLLKAVGIDSDESDGDLIQN